MGWRWSIDHKCLPSFSVDNFIIYYHSLAERCLVFTSHSAKNIKFKYFLLRVFTFVWFILYWFYRAFVCLCCERETHTDGNGRRIENSLTFLYANNSFCNFCRSANGGWAFPRINFHIFLYFVSSHHFSSNAFRFRMVTLWRWKNEIEILVAQSSDAIRRVCWEDKICRCICISV